MVARYTLKRNGNGSNSKQLSGAQRVGLLTRPGNQNVPRLTATRAMGVGGVHVFGGYVRSPEKNADWIGQNKWRTIAELTANVSIIAASVHYFLNLVAHPKWTVRPNAKNEDSKEAKKMAEFVEECIHDMTTPWNRVVRRAAMYRFNGFGIQEWIAKKRDDGTIGFKDIEPRPAFTIEQWEVTDDGAVTGMWQRSPQTQELLGLPRGKLLYLVEDTLTDQPDGLGIFRHLAEPYNRLKEYLALEMRAYERDMRGTPIGRAPITLINKLVEDGTMTQEEGDKLMAGLQSFIQTQVREKNTSLLIDSQPYENQTADGLAYTGTPQWGVELLSGGVTAFGEMANAIDRLQREMARIMGTEHLMMGDQGGNRALAVDKSRNLYLIANAVLSNIVDGCDHDLIDPLWQLNAFDEEVKPYFEVEDVSFKDVQQITAAIREMATAGAVLAPDDPVIDDVRDLLGVSRAPEPDPAMLGGLMPPGGPQPAPGGKQPPNGAPKPGKAPPKSDDAQASQVAESDEADEGKGKVKKSDDETYILDIDAGPEMEDAMLLVGKDLDGLMQVAEKVKKANPYHDERGRFASGPGGGGGEGGGVRDMRFLEADPEYFETGKITTTLPDSPDGPLLFHGTSSAVVDAIVEHGLRPAKPGEVAHGATAAHAKKFASCVIDDGESDTSAACYFVASPKLALEYAEMAAQATGSTPVVIPVHLSTAKAKQMIWDLGEDVKLPGKISPDMLGKPAVGVAAIRELCRKAIDVSRSQRLAGHSARTSGTISGDPSRHFARETREQIRDIFGKAADKSVIFAVLFVDESTEKFNPYHDERGRFTFAPGGAGGGGDGGSAAAADEGEDGGGFKVSASGQLENYDPQPASNATELYERTADPNMTPEDVFALVDPKAAAWAAEAEAKMRDVEQTQTTYMKDGKYVPERAALHDRLIGKMFTDEAISRATPAAGEQPTLYILGGRGGAGKSWFSTSDESPFDASKTININNDEFKEALPEYQGWNAGQLHEESSDIASRAHEVARSAGLNVTYDGTLRSVGSIARVVDAYEKAGYRVEGYFMHTAPQVSAVRAVGRFVRGQEKNGKGRYVPPSYILGSNSNEKTFDAMTPKFSKWAVYDNNSGSGPRLVAKSDMKKFNPHHDERGRFAEGPGGGSSGGGETIGDKPKGVKEYTTFLTENLRDEDKFAAGFRALREESTADIIAIAREFTGRKDRKSRQKALDAIWARHQVILTDRAKARATAGRSAA